LDAKTALKGSLLHAILHPFDAVMHCIEPTQETLGRVFPAERSFVREERIRLSECVKASLECRVAVGKSPEMVRGEGGHLGDELLGPFHSRTLQFGGCHSDPRPKRNDVHDDALFGLEVID
jgi:hypothetical protein